MTLLLEGGGKRPCFVPFIADLVVGSGYRLVSSDLQGGGVMWYGVEMFGVCPNL